MASPKLAEALRRLADDIEGGNAGITALSLAYMAGGGIEVELRVRVMPGVVMTETFEAFNEAMRSDG